MNRILLADDSPHAQRMGERILREEGFEVVSLTDGDSAVLRLNDVDPDLILADVFLPGKSGFDLCRHVKGDPHLQHVRVVLTAGLLEPFDEEEAKRAGCDAILKKPFEASKVMATIHPLVKQAQLARETVAEPPSAEEAIRKAAPSGQGAAPEPAAEAPSVASAAPSGQAAGSEPAAAPVPATEPPAIDPERVRAAVTLALDAALPAMIQEITERVLIALGH